MAEAATTGSSGTPDPTTQTTEEQPQSGGEQQGQQAPADFKTWLDAQAEDVKTLVDGHTRGLRSALDTERTERKNLDKELKKLRGQLEEGSDARKTVEGIQSRLKQMEQQNSFYDEAHRQGATNLGLAYMAAQQSGMFDKDSDGVDWKALKSNFPELFQANKKPNAPPSNGGNGNNNQQPAGGKSMNNFIRRSAGIR